MTKACFSLSAGLALMLVTLGCGQSSTDKMATWQVVSPTDMTAVQTEQMETALAARDAMFASLKGRLQEVVQSEGPAAAIQVCSNEAPQIAERISQEYGLQIGRTSFRLRNTNNREPKWAAQLVRDRVAEPTYLAKDGALAALLPIRIQPPCLMCHGTEATIPPVVVEALAEHYPADRATGFQDGDLRGWFHVQVPAKDTGEAK